MVSFPCPYLDSNVELTDERAYHIANHHPDLLPLHQQYIADTLGDPDRVRRSVRPVHGYSVDGLNRYVEENTSSLW